MAKKQNWKGEQHWLSEGRLLAILDNTTAVIYVKDTGGRYLLVNRQFEDLFHVTREQVVKKTDYDLFPSKMAEAFQANDRRVLESRGSLQFEEIALQDGELHTYLSVKFPLFDSSDNPYAVCGVSTDITERKRMETKLIAANRELIESNGELARSEEALRQALGELQLSHCRLQETQMKLIEAAKMESIGRMAANVAHEVKNPLQTILMGLAYISKLDGASDENVVTTLTCMREAVKRADAIVRDLLYLSAAQELKIEAQDLNTVLANSLTLVNLELSHARITVIRDFATKLPLVPLDRARMEQVFINLFLNAAQAMSQGGTLRVKTSVRPIEMEPKLDGHPPGPFAVGETVVVTEVQDTGAGIPNEKLKRIFEPFFTTKPSGIGTGLGLPVSKQIVDLHGGAITIERAWPSGVKVSVMLKVRNGGCDETKKNPGR